MKKILIKISAVVLLILAIFFAASTLRTNFDGVKKPLTFPQDHGFHYVLSEWLYFTGIVKTETGKEIGFEMTIFKLGFMRWYLMDYVYVGHAAVSDPDQKKHFLGETVSPLYSINIKYNQPEVNINNFSYRFSESDGFAIAADSNGIKLKLKLKPTRGILLHGKDGSILMGDDRESAYYSYTNLETKGTVAYNGKEYNVVSGRTWMDHQWGNFIIPGMHWDWFSFRFDDGGSLMLFNIRDSKDKPRRIEWSYRDASGLVTYGSGAEISAARKWRDDPGKATYPVDWSIRIKELDAQFIVKPLFDAQSVHHVKTPSYWEGLCSVVGTVRGKKATGKVYTEMTFYND
jgi:predicted secreted hydrolase